MNEKRRGKKTEWMKIREDKRKKEWMKNEEEKRQSEWK